MHREIAEILFNLFVLNDQAIAVQMPDGNYIPQKVKFNSSLFEIMIKKESSLGVYQQQYYRDVIKWICIDFDYKIGGEIGQLIGKYVVPFVRYLLKNGISYLVEYSGRRGIHVWINFDTIITKKQGYLIATKLVENLKADIKQSEFYDVDLFPTTIGGNNKYGKHVKLPLSKHKKGSQSYFIQDIEYFVENDVILNDEFWSTQLNILKRYKLNNYYDLAKNLKINDEEINDTNLINYKKEYIIFNKSISIEEIEECCRSSKVLNKMFYRIREGRMTYIDRLIVVGVFSHMGNDEFIHEIFKLQENYNEFITTKNIQRLKKTYYPITMGYLYDLFSETLETHIKSNISVLEFIVGNLNADIECKEYNEEILVTKDKITMLIEKEIEYMLYNDEVIDINTFYELSNFKMYDIKQIKDRVESICKGEYKSQSIGEYKIYNRYEENKEEPRKLVSLSAFDRILTTTLIYEFAKEINWRFDSYSYNINFWSNGTIFFPWYSSWCRFKQDVGIYLKLSLLSDYSMIKLDISKFYDNIYLHAVYKQMKDIVNERSENKIRVSNILKYLGKYTENLMVDINGSIKGVPQGPAYARIIAELFISTIICEFKQNSNYNLEDYTIYRYVDDIFIIYNDDVDGDELMISFSDYIHQRGLNINFSKSKNYGKISEMDSYDKNSILDVDEWNYEVKSVQNLELENETEKMEKIYQFEKYLNRNNEWKISDANFVLNTYIDKVYVELYVRTYWKDIISSKVGRGSIFKKMYEFVCSESDLLLKFFHEERYKSIPFETVNLKNFLSTIFFKLDEICCLVDRSLVEEMTQYYVDKKSDCDKYELSMILAIKRYLSK